MGHILKLAAAVLFFGASAVCAADGKVVANGYMVANGVRMTVESHGGGVGISARETTSRLRKPPPSTNGGHCLSRLFRLKTAKCA